MDNINSNRSTDQQKTKMHLLSSSSARSSGEPLKGEETGARRALASDGKNDWPRSASQPHPASVSELFYSPSSFSSGSSLPPLEEVTVHSDSMDDDDDDEWDGDTTSDDDDDERAQQQPRQQRTIFTDYWSRRRCPRRCAGESFPLNRVKGKNANNATTIDEPNEEEDKPERQPAAAGRETARSSDTGPENSISKCSATAEPTRRRRRVFDNRCFAQFSPQSEEAEETPVGAVAAAPNKRPPAIRKVQSTPAMMSSSSTSSCLRSCLRECKYSGGQEEEQQQQRGQLLRRRHTSACELRTSSSFSVRFDANVDVRVYQTPQEMWAAEGWARWFSYD